MSSREVESESERERGRRKKPTITKQQQPTTSASVGNGANKCQNIGDQIFYGQRKGTDLGTAVLETLELLEKTGGPNAFVNIKSYVPVYESCMQ